MSRPFINISSANKTFGQFKEPKDASEYLHNKKARATYCVANKCAPSIKVYSESDRLLFNKSNQLSLYPCANAINKANLNINLLTRLNLRNVPVIQDASSGAIPSTITLDSVPFLDYVIDPSGSLFGNSICGINNYLNYLTPNTQVSPYILISGNYEITSNSIYNTIITFYGNSVIEFTKSIQINYTIVGGGGGGGSGFFGSNGGGGGGGGGGGVKENSLLFESGEYNINIGSGGLGGSNLIQNSPGTNGETTSIISLLVNIDASGGFGGSRVGTGNGGASGTPGSTGGIGNTAPFGGTGTLGGGGGGAGYTDSGGNGSVNISTLIYGTIFGAGGGGGGGGSGSSVGGTAGNLNAGNGGNRPSGTNAGNGVANTGGGGGGGSEGSSGNSYLSGGNGGSGVAIFSFNV